MTTCTRLLLITLAGLILPVRVTAAGIANQPIAIRILLDGSQRQDGVLVSHGGAVNGYAVYVKDQQVCFCVRRAGQLEVIRLPHPQAEQTKVSARLTPAGKLTLDVNGASTAGTRTQLIPKHPAEGRHVKEDPASAVGPYRAPFRYPGKLISVEVSNRQLLDLDDGAAIPTPQRPHIVIVIADDHGVYHSRPYGADWIKTPHMQLLADEGLLFRRAYVASPSCAPSRAALMTGLMPCRNGVVGNHENRFLKPTARSLMTDFSDLGYDIVWRGKVAHGKQGPGTTEQVQVLNGAIKPLGLDSVKDYLSTRADRTRPVLAMIGSYWPHRPWPQPESVDVWPQQVHVPERTFDTLETRQELTRYVAAVESVDRTLGATRSLISRYLGDEHTIVIYTADHGQAWPFGKWSLYETGIRTPLIIKWPGQIPAGSQTEAMVSWIDLLPTLIDLVGGTPPTDIDGRSFGHVLLEGATDHRDRIFAVHKGDTQQNVYPCRSLRIGNWKYILNLHPEFYYTTHMDLTGPQSPFHNRNWASWVAAAKTNEAAAAFLRAYHSRPAEELYNVASDPFETTNLATIPKHREQLERMRQLVRQRMRRVGDDESLSGRPRLLKDHPLP